MPRPIYTRATCRDPAYQLDWSYAVFWHHPPADFGWLDELRRLNEKDHIRILQHEFERPNVSKFLISTRPGVSAKLIVQRVKGRLQRLIYRDMPNAFRRNYSLRSIGSTRREKLEQYLATQLAHHRMADTRVDERLRQYQVCQPDVDLSRPRETSHARYWYNLHVVLVNDCRYMEIREGVLRAIRDMILAASAAKGHVLSRAAIVPDHIHMTLGCGLNESPEEVVLAYMNNLAYACGMTRLFRYSYYVGTFSEYDLGVIPRA
jgi:REP element-mobilizing transposase RayT